MPVNNGGEDLGHSVVVKRVNRNNVHVPCEAIRDVITAPTGGTHGRNEQLEKQGNLNVNATFTPVRFQIDTVSRLETVPLLKVLSKRHGLNVCLDRCRVNERCNRIESDVVTNETTSL